MAENKFDEDGLASSYLMLVMTVLSLIFVNFRIYKSMPKSRCRCRICVKRPVKKPYKYFFLLVLLSIIANILIKKVITTKISKKAAEFDPYIILDATPDTPASDLKKVYKSKIKAQSKKLKNKNLAASAQDAIKHLNKAYSILKDPEATKNWFTDSSPKELIIALPSFIFGFSNQILGFYITLIAVAIPMFFYIKQKKFNKISASGSLYKSNELFLDEFSNLSDIPSILHQQLILIVSKSIEFSTRRWKTLIPSNIKEKIENDYGLSVLSMEEPYLMILMYLTRETIEKEDKEFIAKKALSLIESYKKIATVIANPKILQQLIIFEKCVMQAIHSPMLALLQYPDIRLETALECLANNSPAQNDKDSNSIVYDQKCLSEYLSENKDEFSFSIIKSIPVVKINTLEAFTYKTDEESGLSFENKNLKLKEKIDNVFVLPKDSLPHIAIELESVQYSKNVHSIGHSMDIPNKWYLFTTVNNDLIRDIIVLDAFEGKKTINIPLNFSSGKESVKLHLLSNGYFNNDIKAALTIQYV